MSQFIYHLIYLMKDKVNETDTSQQPFNMTTLPEKIKTDKTFTNKYKKDNELVKDMFLWSC